MNPIWLLRMVKWLRHTPSPGRVKLVFGVVVLAIIIVGLEWFELWPEWAKAERIRRGI